MEECLLTHTFTGRRGVISLALFCIPYIDLHEGRTNTWRIPQNKNITSQARQDIRAITPGSPYKSCGQTCFNEACSNQACVISCRTSDRYSFRHIWQSSPPLPPSPHPSSHVYIVWSRTSPPAGLLYPRSAWFLCHVSQSRLQLDSRANLPRVFSSRPSGLLSAAGIWCRTQIAKHTFFFYKRTSNRTKISDELSPFDLYVFLLTKLKSHPGPHGVQLTFDH